MRAKAKIDERQLQDMEFEISFRMKISEWKKFREQTKDSWPSWEIARKIDHMLQHVDKLVDITVYDPLHLADTE